MKRQVKKTVQKGLCMLLAGVAVLTASLSLTACVDQHPDSTEGQSQADSVRLVATSQAVAQICDKLELDLVGVCRTSGTLPERYKDVTQVGTAMSPDMEILKSLSPDYVLSPKVLILTGLPGSYIVATENSYVGSLVEMAGGQNVYAGTDEEFLSANTEDIKTKEPDVILRASHAMPEQVQQMFADEFEKNDIWKHFAAVQNGRVYDLDSSLFGMSANFSYQQALEALQPMLYNN